MLQKDYAEQARRLIAKVKELHVEDVRSLKDAVKLVPVIVKAVEQEYWGIEQADKKELAVAVANELIDLPYIPEPAEAVIYGAAIDVAVNTLNQLFGQNWLEIVNRFNR